MSSSAIRELAERIVEMRQIAGLTRSDLAREYGIPDEQYARYESGEVDVPASFLLFLAGKFGVELTTLLTGEEPRLKRYCLTRKDRGVGVDRRKEYLYQNLAYNFQNKKAEPFLVTVAPQPGDAAASLNAHPGQEFNYILSGSMSITIGGRSMVLNEGDCIYFDSTCPHGMLAVGAQPCKFLAIIF